MSYIERDVLRHPACPGGAALGLAGAAQPTRSTGEGEQELVLAAVAADAGEPMLEQAAPQELLGRARTHGTQRAPGLPVSLFVLLEQAFKVVGDHLEDGARVRSAWSIDAGRRRLGDGWSRQAHAPGQSTAQAAGAPPAKPVATGQDIRRVKSGPRAWRPASAKCKQEVPGKVHAGAHGDRPLLAHEARILAPGPARVELWARQLTCPPS